jgi:hypothetical protein
MYLSCFYSRFDLALRLGLFFGQYAVASAFSRALGRTVQGSVFPSIRLTMRSAYGIFRIPYSALRTWQLLFIEGAATCSLALVAWFWLPTGPNTAWFLTKAERAYINDRLSRDSLDQGNFPAFTQRDMVETAKDWKLWFALAVNLCASVPASAFSVFLPLVFRVSAPRGTRNGISGDRGQLGKLSCPLVMS